MTDRQLALYTDRVNLRRPSGIGLEGPEYSDTPDFTDVPCRLTPSIEASVPMVMGRANYDIVQTTDQLRLSIDQEIDDGWSVELVTPGHPEEGTFYMTQGGPRNYQWRGASKTILVKRSTKPPGVL
jgi:hypothetical protein